MREYFSEIFATPFTTFTQIVGFMAMASAIICFCQKDRKRILIWQMICTALWTTHFILLGNATGAAINGMQVTRGIVYYFKENKSWAQKNCWLYIFLVITIALGIVTWESPLSILPIIGTVFSTVSLWLKKPLHIRLLTYPVSLTWGIFDFASNSIAGVLNEIFVIIAITITIFRVDLKGKEKS